MSRSTGVADWAQAAVLAGMAALVLRLLVSGDVRLFVGHVVVVLLWVTMPALAAAAAVSVVSAARAGRTGSTGHGHGPGWVTGLVALPVVAGLAMPLRPLQLVGSTSRVVAARPAVSAAPTPAGRRIDPATGRLVGGNTDGIDPQDTSRNGPIGRVPDSFDPLTGSPADVSVYDYVVRSSSAAGRASMAGRPIAMVGFVSVDPANPTGPWVLARLKVTCCVADALPFLVTSQGSVPRPTNGVWVRVVGHALPPATNGDARFRVESLTVVDEPKDGPYL